MTQKVESLTTNPGALQHFSNHKEVADLTRPYVKFIKRPDELLQDLKNLRIIFDTQKTQTEFRLKIDSGADYKSFKAITDRDFVRTNIG